MAFHDRVDELEALTTAVESPGHDFYRESKASASGLDPEGEADT